MAAATWSNRVDHRSPGPGGGGGFENRIVDA